jgi:hypothetical protein
MKQKHKVTTESDRLARAEELLGKFETEFGEALALVNTARNDRDLDASLLQAGETRQRAYAFANALYEATGRSIYRRKWDFHRQLSGALQDRWDRLKHAIPRSPLPREAVAVLEELRAVMPRPKIFEGESEYQKWLKDQNLREVYPNDYQSQTRGRARLAST